MLVRPDVTYIDHATKAAARVFPIGTKWLEFESRLQDRGVPRRADGSGDRHRWPLALQTFATCECQIATFELATRINQAMAPALASIFNALPSTLAMAPYGIDVGLAGDLA